MYIQRETIKQKNDKSEMKIHLPIGKFYDFHFACIIFYPQIRLGDSPSVWFLLEESDIVKIMDLKGVLSLKKLDSQELRQNIQSEVAVLEEQISNGEETDDELDDFLDADDLAELEQYSKEREFADDYAFTGYLLEYESGEEKEKWRVILLQPIEF